MQVELKTTELKAALECVAKKYVRHYLEGVCVDFVNGQDVMIVSTNGHIMFACKSRVKSLDTDFIGQIIIPTDAIKQELKSVVKGYDYMILKSLDDGMYQLGFNTIFKPIEGKFVDYRRVIPQKVSGEIGQFNNNCLVKISNAMKIYKGISYSPALFHNGGAEGDEDGKPSVMVSGNAICLIMPMTKGISSYKGFFIPKDVQVKPADDELNDSY